MATIGSIIIGIRTNTSDLKKGLGQARNSISDFGSSLTSAKGLLLGFGAALATGAFASFVKSSAETIDNVSKLADRLGTTTENFQGLAHAANLSGVSQESLAGAMGKFQKLMGEGNPKAISTLEAMGLSAEALKNSDPVDAIKQIADGLNQIPNSADRAAATTALFGKSGQELGNLLMSGSQGIAAAQAEAEKLGLTFDRVDGAKVEAALDNFTRVEGLMTGVGQSIAVEVAPYLTAITDQIIAFATEGDNLKNMMGGAFSFVRDSIIVCADAFDVLMSVFKLVQSGLTTAISYVIKGISMLVKAINYIPGVEIDTSTLDAVGDELNSLGQQQFSEVGSSGAGDTSRKFFTDVESGANKSAQAIADAAAKQRELNASFSEGAESGQKLIDKLNEQVSTFGMSSTEAEIFKLAQEGASSSILTEAKALQTQLEGLEATKKATEEALKAEEKRNEDLKSSAQSITDSVKTPAEQFAEEMSKLETLKFEGLITDDTFSRASDKLKNESTGELASNSVSAISLGSSEAFAAMDRLRGLNSGSDAVPKQQLGEQQKGNVLLAEISRRLGQRIDSFDLNTV